MTFEEWISTTSLPSMAKDQLPNALSEVSKRKLLKRTDAEDIIQFAIDEINRGSVKTVDAIVAERLVLCHYE